MCTLYSGSAQLLGKGIDLSRSTSAHAGCGNGQEGEVFKEKTGCESSPGKGAGKGHQK